MVRSSSLALVVGLALALAASARGQNLLPNPDFDSGLDGWQTAGGSWTAGPDSGSCALSGAAAADPDTYLALYNAACIPVDPSQTPVLHLGALFRTDGTPWVRLYLHYFSDSGCASHLGWSDFVFTSPSASWSGVQGELAIPGGVASVNFWIDFNPSVGNPPPYDAGVDRAWLGTVPRVFTDGFEAEDGTACNWSNVLP